MTYNKEPFLCHVDFWHFHPEFEIVYVPHGTGRRFVGQKVSRFEDGDLILLGPNIPHNAFNFGFESTGYEEYVIQFKLEQIGKMGEVFPEFARVTRLLTRARSGICITGEARHRIGAMIKEMYALCGFQRLMKLFAVLRELSLSTEFEDLGTKKFLSVNPAYVKRIERVYQVIQKEYQHDLSTRKVAFELSMTESSFCRFFRSATGKTFKKVLTEVRIEKGSALLLRMGKTPNDYRRSNRSPF